MEKRKRENGKPGMGFLRCAAAVGLMGCAFLCGGTQADAATMKGVFDEQYYADQYPDLKAQYGYEREALWQHFLNHGMGEGRSMNRFIDIAWYRAAYPDLDSVFGDDWDAYIDHYLTCGVFEGRQAGGEFDILGGEARQIVFEEIISRSEEQAEPEPEPEVPEEQPDEWLLENPKKAQVLTKDSYGAQWGLDEVDRPELRSREESLRRLGELGQDNELIAEIYRNSSRYYDSMLAAVANNPELADFVSNYRGTAAVASGGFTEGELALEYPLFLQWDPRWGYVTYGVSGGCIGIAGCGPTCLSMALYYLTGDAGITPDVAAAYSMSHGHYVPGAGTSWKLLSELPTVYGVKVSEPMWSEQTMKSALDQGKIIICSMRQGDFTAGGHFIVVYGYDEEGFKINDPNSVARSIRRWTYGEIATQIKHIWVLGEDAAPAAPAVIF